MNSEHGSDRVYCPGHPQADSTERIKVLLFVIGRTPQIITETVYALATSETEPWIPDEIRVITTALARDQAIKTLFNDGEFHRLCQDLDMHSTHFSPESFITIKLGNRDLTDIRTPADNIATADCIMREIRHFTEFSNTELHVSLAGGRKTMSFFAGYALSIFGRAQDRLSHVLVSDPYETFPTFFYPTRQSQIVWSTDRSQSADARKAQVELAAIPFVRLNNLAPTRKISSQLSYAELCRVLEQGAHLKIDLNRLNFEFSRSDRLSCSGDRKGSHRLQARPAGLYAYYAYRAWRGEPFISDIDALEDQRTLLRFYEIFAQPADDDLHPYPDNLRSYRSKTDRAVRDLLQGSRLANVYQHKSDGRPKCYGISLNQQQIDFVALPADLR